MNEFVKKIKNYFKSIIPIHTKDIKNNFLKLLIYTNKLGVTYAHYNVFFFNQGIYKMYKTLAPDMTKVIKQPKRIDKNEFHDITLNQLNSQYEQYLLSFINTLENNFEKKQLQFMYKNLKKIKIETKSKMNDSLGKYNILTNKITINFNKFLGTVIHELFHMATTTKSANEVHSGFETKITFLSLGEAINEGYTEIMTNRYFHIDINNSGYNEQIIICKELEEIIGRKKIEKLYMNADLNGLIKELSKYALKEDIIEFIKVTDEILTIYNKIGNYKLIKPAEIHMNEILNTKRIQVYLFLDTVKTRKQEHNNQLLITKYDFKSLYTVNNKSYKKLYLQCLTLMHFKNNIESLKEITDKSKYYYFFNPFASAQQIFDIIGYDKLEYICYNGGINLLIEELKKYLDEDCIYQFLDSINYNMLDFRKELDLAYKFNKILEMSKITNGAIKLPFNCGFEFQDNSFNEMYFDYLLKEYTNNDDVILLSLEKIIGKEKLYNFFINGDTIGFVSELKKYRSNCLVEKLINSDSGIFDLYRNIIQYVHNINFDIELNDNNILENKELYTYKQQQYPYLYANIYKYNYLFNRKDLDDLEKSNLKFAYDGLFDIDRLIKIIGYDKLDDICYNGGINFLSDELKKYLGEEKVYSFLELLNKECLSKEEVDFINDCFHILENISFNMRFEDRKFK